MRWIMIVTVSLLVLLGILAAGMYTMIHVPGRSHAGPVPPLDEGEKALRENLRRHIEMLAGEIGERNLWNYSKLEASHRYIRKVFEDLGCKVEVQEFVVLGKVVKNLEVELGGTSLPQEIVLVGAHYDTVDGSPGANDNASGVAAMLEMARAFAGKKTVRSLRFVAFVNEEAPFFQTDAMGSSVYARRSRQRDERIEAMYSLETIGYYSEAQGSQNYPFPFAVFYPKIGNFVGFVGNIASRNLVRRTVASFRRNCPFPSEGVAAPSWITGIGWSDQWSFWKENYPGVMVTDTALFRYEHYHTQDDTPDKIDYTSLARVVSGLTLMVEEIAGIETE